MYADFLDISQEVQQALREGKPVVALESVMVACGLPHPTNLEAGRKCEQILRDAGVVPATIAMLGGRIKVGLSDAELEYIGQPGKKIFKSSRLDLPVLAARKADAATTVCATMYAAHLAGRLAALAASIAARKRRWIFPRIWKSWPIRRSWWSAPARRRSSILA